MSFGWVKFSSTVLPVASGSFFGIQLTLTGGGQQLVNKLVESPKRDFTKLNLYRKGLTKEQIRAEGNEAIKKLNDYTMRIVTPCSVGTGWILDYQLPKNKDEYPTTWYIGINAHVAGYVYLDNPYEQLIPNSIERSKELIKQHGKNWSFENIYTWANCNERKKKGYFDLSFIRQDNKKQLGYWGAISKGKVKSPRLFYLPNGFLTKEDPVTQKITQFYRDFAIIEFEFTDQEYAKAVTDNFATKYPVDTTKAINIFAPPLEQRYSSWEELEKSDENYYSLGYPQSRDPYSYKINWNEKEARASKLSKSLQWQAKTQSEKVRGYINLEVVRNLCSHCDNLVSLEWNKSIKEIGHSYLLENYAWESGFGSSGSLYIDGQGNLLGVHNMGKAHWTYVIPLISGKIFYKSIESPAYDLIRGGAEGQKTSYKQQIDRYIKSKGITTWLMARNWEHKS